MPHELRGQRGRDREGTGAMVQHRAVAGPNEAVCQGYRHHAIVAYDCASLHLDDGCALRCGAAQVHNK